MRIRNAALVLALAACARGIEEDPGSTLELAVLNADGSTVAGTLRIEISRAGTNELVAATEHDDSGASSPITVARLFAGTYAIAATQRDGIGLVQGQAFDYVAVDGRQPAAVTLILRKPSGSPGQHGSDVTIATDSSFAPTLVALVTDTDLVHPDGTVSYTVVAEPSPADPAAQLRVTRNEDGTRTDVPRTASGYTTSVLYPASLSSFARTEIDVLNAATGAGNKLHATAAISGPAWTAATVDFSVAGDVWGTFDGVAQAYNLYDDPLGSPSFLRLAPIDGALLSYWLLGEDSRFVGFAVPPGAADTVEAVIDLDGDGVLGEDDSVVAYHPQAHVSTIAPYRARVGSRLHPFAQTASLQAIPESDGEVALLWSGEGPVNIYRRGIGGWQRIASGVSDVSYTDAPAPGIYYYYLALVGPGDLEVAASNTASTTTL